MRLYIRNVLSILFLIISYTASANDSAYVQFNFAPPLHANNFFISLHDGISEYKIDPQHTHHWCGQLFAPFGYIEIGYRNSDTTAIIKKVFFKKGNTKVSLTPSPDINEYYSINEKLSVNVVSYNKLGGAALDSFIKDIVEVQIDFILKNKNKFGNDYSILQKAFALCDSVTYKKIEFIRQFPGLYISYWTFLNEIVKTHILKPDSLMIFYNSILPDTFKKSQSARHLAEIIQNKIAVTSNKSFPNFSALDIKSNKIELSKLKGRYVLVQFWASWCIPCIKEMPVLKSINDKYKDDAFTLLSFSVDKDSLAFRKAIDKYSMNWIQVFGDDRLYNSLAYLPIPQLYLIDKNGYTIYSSTTINDPDLELLKKMLHEHLNK